MPKIATPSSKPESATKIPEVDWDFTKQSKPAAPAKRKKQWRRRAIGRVS